MNWFQTKAYLKHIRKAKYRKGHGIHPPFAFHLIREVIFDKLPYYHFSKIKQIRKSLILNKKQITISDFGAGSKFFKNNVRKISSIAKQSASSEREGELMTRLISDAKPNNIIELGSSLGIGTLYLALARPSAEVFTIEGCQQTANIAKQTYKKAKAQNIHLKVGKFENKLPEILNHLTDVDFVFFDGYHAYQPTIDYFNLCLKKINSNSVFVFDDIHWSTEMERAWDEITKNQRVRISIDLFHLGIIYFNPKYQKQNYKVRW